jgi:hypothetical protein
MAVAVVALLATAACVAAMPIASPPRRQARVGAMPGVPPGERRASPAPLRRAAGAVVRQGQRRPLDDRAGLLLFAQAPVLLATPRVPARSGRCSSWPQVRRASPDAAPLFVGRAQGR